MKFSPGCNCCACVADADHVCLCSPPCFNAFPRHFFTEDDHGALTLTYVGSNKWTFNRTISGLTTACSSSPINCVLCGPQNVTISYELSLNCTTGWKFLVSYSMSCTGPYQYSAPIVGPCGPGGTSAACAERFAVEASDTIAFTCDFADGFAFDLATTLFGLPTLGGGGAFVVVP